MNGSNVVISTAVAAGIEICFTNPGTTELPLLTAMDTVQKIRPVLGLTESVCTGAADGYARMLQKPAMTLLHLGPGLANGIANLHNARRAKSPVFNIIGEHATWHRSADPPLAMDIQSLASTVSDWQHTCETVQTLSCDTVNAIGAAMNGAVSTLIVPHDILLKKCERQKIDISQPTFNLPDSKLIDRAAQSFKKHKKIGIIMGGRTLYEPGLLAGERIRAKTGCDLLSVTFPPCLDRGTGLPALRRLPYFPEQAIKLLSKYEFLILADTPEPVAFFGYEGVCGNLIPEELPRICFTGSSLDAVSALECLADALNAPPQIFPNREGGGHIRPAMPTGPLTIQKAGAVLAALQPERAIIVDEAITGSGPYVPLGATLPRHTYMTLTGGAIGFGIPCATGAALACPDRPVICFQADGSAMYSLQALWTQAREQLDVTTLICANKSYKILQIELARQKGGIQANGLSYCLTDGLSEKIMAMTELDRPAPDWAKLAAGFGVSAVAVDNTQDMAEELEKALAEPGPHLIELTL